MISAIRISANSGGWEISQNGAYTSPISATVSSGNTATVEFTLQAEDEYTDVDLAVKTGQARWPTTQSTTRLRHSMHG